jgi:hypothetical protein
MKKIFKYAMNTLAAGTFLFGGCSENPITVIEQDPKISSISINGGDSFVNSKNVKVKFAYKYGNQAELDGDVTSPKGYVNINPDSTVDAVLSPGDGLKRIGARVRNSSGESRTINDSIWLCTDEAFTCKVTNLAGKPLPNVKVCNSSETAYSDANGLFSLKNISLEKRLDSSKISMSSDLAYPESIAVSGLTQGSVIKLNQIPKLNKITSPLFIYAQNPSMISVDTQKAYSFYCNNASCVVGISNVPQYHIRGEMKNIFDDDKITGVIVFSSSYQNLPDSGSVYFISSNDANFNYNVLMSYNLLGFDTDKFMEVLRKKSLTDTSLNSVLASQNPIQKFCNPQDFLIMDGNSSGVDKLVSIIKNSSDMQFTEMQKPVMVCYFTDNTDFNALNPFIRPDGSTEGWTNLPKDKKNALVDSLLKVSKVDTNKYIPSIFVCQNYSDTLMHEFRKKFNLPLCGVYLSYHENCDSSNSPIGHAKNAILVGDNPSLLSNWRLIEPQTDGTHYLSDSLAALPVCNVPWSCRISTDKYGVELCLNLEFTGIGSLPKRLSTSSSPAYGLNTEKLVIADKSMNAEQIKQYFISKADTILR